MNAAYALEEIRTHWDDLPWWRKRVLTRVVGPYFKSVRNHQFTPIMERDWDNLVILDACRYDLFEEVNSENPLPGTLEKRTSAEAGTPGFLQENFAGRTCQDTVYVTGNPYVNTDLKSETFHAVESVWKDNWDDKVHTVQPGVMADRTIEIAEKYPQKRIISHFLQPHTPFVGDIQVGDRDAFVIREHALGNEDARKSHKTPFEMLELGEVGRAEVWRAYRSNLEHAWPSVERLLRTLSGLSAVTSDHGNAVGERAWPFPLRVYGHPLGILIPALTDVPWLTHRNGDRRQILSDPPIITEDNQINEKTNERLRMLGYK